MPEAPSQHILDTIQTAIDNWIEDNPDSKIRMDVHTTLDNSKQEMIVKLLGFTQAYSGAEWDLNVDRYDNSSESPVAQFIKNNAQMEIEQWFNNLYIADVLSDYSLQEKFKQEYQEYYEEEFRQKMQERVKQEVSQDVTQFLQELQSGPMKLLDMRETLAQLINKGEDSGHQHNSG